jgi:hypothetical protein
MNLANNQVSHNTKIKSREENRQLKPPTSLSRTKLHSTKWSDWKKGMETTLLKNIIQYRFSGK